MSLNRADAFLRRLHADDSKRTQGTQGMPGQEARRRKEKAAFAPVAAAAGVADVSDPRLDEAGNLAARELSSILRCGTALVISRPELRLLEQVMSFEGSNTGAAPQTNSDCAPGPSHLHWARSKLVYSPLRPFPAALVPPHAPREAKARGGATGSAGGRRDVVMLGTFRHAPNVDSVRVMHRLWPRIRERVLLLRTSLPAAAAAPPSPLPECHVFGSACDEASRALSEPQTGFLVKGDLFSLEALRGYRVLAAPLRFGAGLKGKVLDALAFGLPVVTTSIGAEGFVQPLDLQSSPGTGGGAEAAGHTDPPSAAHRGLRALAVADDEEAFVQTVAEALVHDDQWESMQSACAGDLKVLCPDEPDTQASLSDIVCQRAREDLVQNRGNPLSVQALLDGNAFRSSYWKQKYIIERYYQQSSAATTDSSVPAAAG
jgi:hypothetical protein